jgi:hypothetical protein
VFDTVKEPVHEIHDYVVEDLLDQGSQVVLNLRQFCRDIGFVNVWASHFRKMELSSVYLIISRSSENHDREALFL